MALIEVFHVVASQFDIDAAGAVDIPQGSLVGLGIAADGTDEGKIVMGSTTRPPIGIAGDSRSGGTTSYTPESGSALSRNPGDGTGALVTGAWGVSSRYTQNRVADNYNEVLASGKMTVYHSGGEFWTDMYETHDTDGDDIAANYTNGCTLYVSNSGNTGTDDEPDTGGRFTTENIGTANIICGRLLQGPLDYPSGVPGTTTGFTQLPEGGNSLSWGQFIRVKLAL